MLSKSLCVGILVFEHVFILITRCITKKNQAHEECFSHKWAEIGTRVTVLHETRGRRQFHNATGVVKRIVKHNKYKYVLVALDSAELTEELLRKQTDSVYLKHKQMPGWLACRLDKRKFYVRYAQK